MYQSGLVVKKGPGGGGEFSNTPPRGWAFIAKWRKSYKIYTKKQLVDYNITLLKIM